MDVIDDKHNDLRRFFKIILEPDRNLQKLGIPIKFMAEYGNDLLDVVSLKIPTGKTWEVELMKENGRTWFGDGWPEIATYCSLCPGHFLMFTYGGMSQFNLDIFDMTACEIDYPLDPQEPREVNERVTPETKARANPSVPNSSSKENGMLALIRKHRRKFGGVTRKDIMKINSFKFENPSFAMVMQPTHVAHTHNNFRVSIPLTFAAKYFKNAQGTTCTFQNATGDTWPIKYIGIWPKLMKFSAGWRDFALDNKLCVNDICVFELINVAECLFKVEILRHSSPASSVDVGVAGPSTATRSPEVEHESIIIDD